MVKIVILDGRTENPGDLSWDWLKKIGEVKIYDFTPPIEDVIAERIEDAEIVITNKCPISARTMDRCPTIRFITVLATGYNVVDYEYAAKKGIPVSNVPSYGTASVGQYAIALLLEICGRVGHHSDAVHQGRWGKGEDFCFWDYPLIELAGKTMGIIGFGRIGRTTGKIAKALGMKVLAAGSRETDEGREIAEYVDMDTLLSESDVISLHCPLFADNKEMINKDTISKMKDGVIIINNSRGGLIAEQDLADALNSGKIYAAGLDVVSTEPIREDNPLYTAKNCIITPHISWAPKESRQRIMECTEKNLLAFIAGDPINTVNM